MLYLSKEQVKAFFDRLGPQKATALLSDFFHLYKNYLNSTDLLDIYNDPEYQKIILKDSEYKIENSQLIISKNTKYIYEYLENKVSSSTKILEVGCGAGDFCIAIASKNVKKVIGVDISRVSIEIAVEKLNKNNLTNLSFITGDICDLNFSEKYDYIVMNDVFEHLSDYELYKIFDKIYGLLDDSSKILLHTPNGYTMWYKSNMFPIPILRQIVRFLRETFGMSPGLQIYEQSYINQAHINIKNFYQIKQFFKKYNYKVSVIYDPHTHSYKSFLNKFRSLSMTVILHKKQI